jgi:hypothetical protein
MVFAFAGDSTMTSCMGVRSVLTCTREDGEAPAASSSRAKGHESRTYMRA